MASKKNNDPVNLNLISLKLWASLIKELGIPAFLVFFFTMIFLCYSTKEQKEIFIDEFFLFKDVDKNPFPFAFVVILLLLIIIFQYLFYNKSLKLAVEENKRMGEEKGDLQKRLLNRRLNSSK